MKSSSIIIYFIFSAFMTTGQDIQQVVRAFNSGDANMISQQFAERVEICMDDQVKMFNKKDAVNHLNKWFNSIQPKSFSARHSGGKTGGIQYYIGLLKSQSGDFRVFVYFNSEKNNYKINEIRVNTL